MLLIVTDRLAIIYITVKLDADLNPRQIWHHQTKYKNNLSH